MKRWLKNLKFLLDAQFPTLSTTYRRVRDYWYFDHAKPYDTAFGFQLYGDAALDTSRIDSYEAQLFLEHLEQADLFIDIGANVGLFTLIAARECVPVIAVEPHPLNLQLLYRNLKLNNVTGVEVYPIALSDTVGVLPLFGGGQGATLHHGWGGIQSTYQTLAPVNTLANLIGERFSGKQLLIKVDVEGNEYRVLKGALSVLLRTPPPVWIVEHGFMENFNGAVNPHFADGFALFYQHGYAAYTVEHKSRRVSSADLQQWLARGQREFGGINYLFKFSS